MKLKKFQLKQIINEELSQVLREQGVFDRMIDRSGLQFPEDIGPVIAGTSDIWDKVRAGGGGGLTQDGEPIGGPAFWDKVRAGGGGGLDLRQGGERFPNWDQLTAGGGPAMTQGGERFPNWDQLTAGGGPAMTQGGRRFPNWDQLTAGGGLGLTQDGEPFPTWDQVRAADEGGADTFWQRARMAGRSGKVGPLLKHPGRGRRPRRRRRGWVHPAERGGYQGSGPDVVSSAPATRRSVAAAPAAAPEQVDRTTGALRTMMGQDPFTAAGHIGKRTPTQRWTAGGLPGTYVQTPGTQAWERSRTYVKPEPSLQWDEDPSLVDYPDPLNRPPVRSTDIVTRGTGGEPYAYAPAPTAAGRGSQFAIADDTGIDWSLEGDEEGGWLQDPYDIAGL